MADEYSELTAVVLRILGVVALTLVVLTAISLYFIFR